MKYKVVLQRSEEGVAASVPGIPGCWSQGQTEAEALENIRSALQEYLAVVAEQTQGAEVHEVDVAVSCRRSPASRISRLYGPLRRPDSASLARVSTSS